MTRRIGAQHSYAVTRPRLIRLDRDSVRDAWLSLRPRRAQPVYMVARRTAMVAVLRAPMAAPFDTVGRFDGTIPLEDLEAEVRHTAEELALTLNLRVAA